MATASRAHPRTARSRTVRVIANERRDGAINAIRNGEPFAPRSGKLPGSLFHKPVHPSLLTTHASPLVAPCESLRIPSQSGALHRTWRLLARHFPHKKVGRSGATGRAPPASHQLRFGCGGSSAATRRPGGQAKLQSSGPARMCCYQEIKSRRVMHVSYREVWWRASYCMCSHLLVVLSEGLSRLPCCELIRNHRPCERRYWVVLREWWTVRQLVLYHWFGMWRS